MLSINSDLEPCFYGTESDKKQAKVGLLLGISKMHCEIFDVAWTPDDDTSGVGVSARGALRAEELIDHGCLVNKILPGGIDVVGICCIGAQNEKHLQLMDAKKVLKKIYDNRSPTDKETWRVWLRSSQADRKLSATLFRVSRSGITEERGAAVTFKTMQPLVAIHCRFPIDVSLTLQDTQPSLKAIAKQVLASASAFAKDAVAVCGSSMLVEDQTLDQIVQTGDTQIQLFLPFGMNEKINEGTVGSYVTVKGNLDCRAVGHQSDSVKQTIEILKLDALHSMKTRLQILRENQSDEAESTQCNLTQSEILPRRVWGIWKFGVPLCDYLMKDEDKEDAVYNIEGLTNFRVTQIEDKEQLPNISSRPQEWSPFQEARQETPRARRVSLPNVHTLSILVGVLAVLLGFVYYWTSKEN